jgi:integrase
MRLDALRPESIEGLKSPERAHVTTRHILLIFSMALNRALEWGLMSKNPCKGVRKPKPTRKMRALSEEEVGRLLGVVRPEDEAFYRVAVTLGLRNGELLTLKWEDVDLSSRTLEVKASVDTHLKGERWGPTKTHERRTITFGKKIKASLARCERNGTHLVFPCPNGKVRRAGTLDNQFRRYKEAAGLPESVRIQDLRHTAATLALRAGTPIHVVSRMLGHASPDITLRVYSHVLSGMGEEAARMQDTYQF